MIAKKKQNKKIHKEKYFLRTNKTTQTQKKDSSKTYKHKDMTKQAMTRSQ